MTCVASWCSCYSTSCVINFSKLNIIFFGIPHRHCILMIHHFSQMFLAFYAYFDVCWISFPMNIFCANIATWSSWYFTTFLKSIFNIFRMFSHLMIVEFDSYLFSHAQQLRVRDIWSLLLHLVFNEFLSQKKIFFCIYCNFVFFTVLLVKNHLLHFMHDMALNVL